MHLPLCIAIFYNLPWFCSIKGRNKKLQCNAENAWGNRMCKCAFNNNTKLFTNTVLLYPLCKLIFLTASISMLIVFWPPCIFKFVSMLMLLYLCKSIIDDESYAYIPPTQKALLYTEKTIENFLRLYNMGIVHKWRLILVKGMEILFLTKNKTKNVN